MILNPLQILPLHFCYYYHVAKDPMNENSKLELLYTNINILSNAIEFLLICTNSNDSLSLPPDTEITLTYGTKFNLHP